MIPESVEDSETRVIVLLDPHVCLNVTIFSVYVLLGDSAHFLWYLLVLN